MRIPPRLNAPLAVIVVLSACTEPASKVPAGPSGPDTVSVTIDGPSSIAPGQSAQFTATMRLSDGTTKTAVSPSVTWRSTNNAIFSVNTSGLATARPTAGEAILSADVPRLTTNSVRSASREIVVLPDGTFRLAGMVTDAEFPTVPVPGAIVRVGTGNPVTTTDNSGRYKLYGVPPNPEIRVTADGYQTQVQSVQLTTNSTRDFQLALPGPRLNFAGNYRLAIDFASSCNGSPVLSADLQHRRYDAVIAQNGPSLDVTLTEPIFRVSGLRGNRFSGQAGATGAIFTLESYGFYYYYYGPLSYPSVAERLGNGTYLVVDGRAVTTAVGGSLVGQINGGMTNWDSRFPNSAFFLGGCFSSTIQFSLTPR